MMFRIRSWLPSHALRHAERDDICLLSHAKVCLARECGSWQEAAALLFNDSRPVTSSASFIFSDTLSKRNSQENQYKVSDGDVSNF